MLVSILIFPIMFGVIVIAHEFGHYAVARRHGIRVVEFDIGMGPTLVSKKVGETDFCLKALPIGGACIFDGLNGLETGDTASMDEHSFPNAGVFARIATVLAGPVANFLLGLLFAFLIVSFDGTDLPVIQQVMEDSAAEEAGILPGDVIKSIGGERIHIYREISLVSLMNYGDPLHIVYERNGERMETTLTPKYYEDADRYYIGFLGSGEYVKLGALQVFPYTFYEAEYWFRATWKSIGSIFTGHFSRDDLSGPVGVVKIVDDTYEEVSPYGLSAVLLTFLNLATLLSINLGVMNLLPLPALDGGRLVFLLIEAVRGKPVPPEKEGYVHLAGAMALAVLMVFVLFNDISRFFR